MKINHIKFFAAAIIALPILIFAIFNVSEVPARAYGQDDAASAYKTKCAACHSPKAEKFFDPAKAIEGQVEIILKGKKGEKPPYMPGFEAKGMTPEEAKGLAEYMKQLRNPPSN